MNTAALFHALQQLHVAASDVMKNSDADARFRLEHAIRRAEEVMKKGRGK